MERVKVLCNRRLFIFALCVKLYIGPWASSFIQWVIDLGHMSEAAKGLGNGVVKHILVTTYSCFNFLICNK